MDDLEVESLVSCLCCGCITLGWVVDYGGLPSTVLWDPGFTDRRFVRSTLGRTWVEWTDAGQSWGLIYSGAHECPPGEYPPGYLEREERRHGSERN